MSISTTRRLSGEERGFLKAQQAADARGSLQASGDGGVGQVPESEDSAPALRLSAARPLCGRSAAKRPRSRRRAARRAPPRPAGQPPPGGEQTLPKKVETIQHSRMRCYVVNVVISACVSASLSGVEAGTHGDRHAQWIWQ